MNSIYKIFTGLLLSLSMACHAPKKAEKSSSEMNETVQKQTNHLLNNNPIVWKLDLLIPDRYNYNLDSLKYLNGKLTFWINYSGGCEKHEFFLYTDGNLLKSNPPALNMALIHKDNDDACRELKKENITFETDSLFQKLHNNTLNLIINKKHQILIRK